MGLFTRKRDKMQELVAALFKEQLTFAIKSDIDSTANFCEDLIATAIASMSFNIFDVKDRKKIPYHYLYKSLLNPNTEEPRFTFFYNLIRDYFRGNIFIYYKLLETGEYLLFRLPSKDVKVTRSSIDNSKQYEFNGTVYKKTEVLHIPSRYGYNGTTGRDIKEVFAEIFSINQKLYHYMAGVIDNTLQSKLILDFTKSFPNATAEQIEAIRTKFVAQYAGVTNAGKPIIKTQAFDIQEFKNEQIDNRAMQLAENRSYQEREIAKLYGVPVELISGSAKDLESIYTLFIDTAVKPICETLEDYLSFLFIDTDRIYKYIEFDYNSLIKTNLMTKIEAYAKQLSNGILTINEVRKKENLTQIEGGDTNIIYGGNFLPVRQDILDAYMASAKLKAAQLESVGLGDDKK